MKLESLSSALLCGYPVTLCIVLALSRLFLFRRSQRQEKTWAEAKSQERYFKIILLLHGFLCVTLFSNIIVAFYIIKNSPDFSSGQGYTQSYMASALAIFLFFTAGILPDPDIPYTPTVSSLIVWINAFVFEILILTTTIIATPLMSLNPWSLQAAQVAMCISRAVILFLMSAVFCRWQYQSTLVTKTLDSDSSERESLLEHSTNSESSDYGATTTGGGRVGPSKVLDAQSYGMLDYIMAFRTLFPYIWPSDSRFQQAIAVGCFLLLLLQRAVNIMVPYQLGVVITALGKDSVMPYKEIAFYILYRSLQGQQGILGSIRSLLWIPIGQSTYRRLTYAAYEHVLGLSLDFHLSKRTGEVMSALSKGSAINTFLDGFVFQLFPMVADLWIAAIYFFFQFDAFYSLIVIAVMWTYTFVTIYMAKYRGRARREMTNKDRNMDAAKVDAIMSYETVHHNCAIPSELSRFQQLCKSFQKAEFSVLFSLNSLNAIQNLVFTFGILLVSLLSAYQISIGIQEVAVFVSLLAYFAQLQAPLNFFGSFYTQVQNNMVDAERMLSLFAEKPQVVDGIDATPISSFKGQVSFKNVNFGYDSRKPALRNVSFVVKPGTSTAIVGESGSGKSTILKLLFRFYEVNSGSILFDNCSVEKITISSLRQHIGVVPQDTILFNESIMYNLLYARPNATVDEVYDACRAASIHDKIMQFPDAYETKVGERGLRLSGGEKQRLAIARTILKAPQIMLLDEATASLDSHTEKLIQSSLEMVTKGRTTITIAHRLSTITNANQILVLHSGEIVERGSHNYLLGLGGRYKKMWDKQTKADEIRELPLQSESSADVS